MVHGYPQQTSVQRRALLRTWWKNNLWICLAYVSYFQVSSKHFSQFVPAIWPAVYIYILVKSLIIKNWLFFYKGEVACILLQVEMGVYGYFSFRLLIVCETPIYFLFQLFKNNGFRLFSKLPFIFHLFRFFFLTEWS